MENIGSSLASRDFRYIRMRRYNHYPMHHIHQNPNRYRYNYGYPLNAVVDNMNLMDIPNSREYHQPLMLSCKSEQKFQIKKYRKRKNPDKGDLPTKKSKMIASHTALACLNEMKPGLKYKVVSSDGPPHMPNFVVSVEIDGIEFTGNGNSKKSAKQTAAQSALAALCPHLYRNLPTENVDFTEDKLLNNESPTPTGFHSNVKRAKLEVLVSKAISGNANPVMVLNEIRPGLEFECISREGCQDSITPFTFKVKVDNNIYQGSGISKKLAKAAAAKSAILNEYSPWVSTVLTHNIRGQTFVISPTIILRPNIADMIFNIVNQQYENITSTMPEFSKRKVLSGIVMTTSPDCADGKIINFTTGTKCVSGEHISCKGASLNDCHAEILSRRALIVFLYNQLILHAKQETANDSIFELKTDGKGFKLKPNIRFHLYVSTSCCGDSRIFSPHEKETNDEDSIDKHPNRQSRGQLRTKIESGEGTIPVKSSKCIQTWDGVMMGQRLLTMSCSDKLAKWNVVGIQGSLLSHFIDPIYLHSVVLGSLFHPTHMKRALYGRVERTLSGLPPPFKLNKILMNTISSPEARHTGKAPSYSVNWITDECDVEVVNAITGKTYEGNMSRLCKQSLFAKFKNLLLLNLPTTAEADEKMPEIYAEVKNTVVNYLSAKQEFYQACVKANLGTWIKKPIEQDDFELEKH